MATTRFRRSSRERMLAGVAGGMADYFDVDAVFVRLGWVVLTFATAGLGILMYIAMVIIMPKDHAAADEGPVLEEDDIEALDDLESSEGPRGRRPRRRGREGKGRHLLALVLIVVGALFLLNNLGIFWWLSWDVLWPVVLIGLGAAILFGGMRRG